MLKVVLEDALGAPGDASASRLDLAPQSAVRVKLYRDRRSVEMLRGTVRFDVARDAGRPFEVLTSQARIEVIGTVFTVRDRGGPVSVSVERGQVRVHVLSRGVHATAAQEAPAVDLVAGQVLSIENGRAKAIHHADVEDLSGLRGGWLVFENHALADALATINAYRTQPIEMPDPRVGALRLTGRFRANDTAGLVAALPAILPLAATSLPDGRVQLRMR